MLRYASRARLESFCARCDRRVELMVLAGHFLPEAATISGSQLAAHSPERASSYPNLNLGSNRTLV